MKAMEEVELNYLESLSWNDGEGCSKIQEKLGMELSPNQDLGKEKQEMKKSSGAKMVIDVSAADVADWITPEANISATYECKIVGSKLYSLINEESHHSKWEEFRKLAKEHRGMLSSAKKNGVGRLR